MMNALLPDANILPMHCSANVGQQGDVAPVLWVIKEQGRPHCHQPRNAPLIGDDEHGWGDNGVFNFEGGCYAKTIRLKQDLEPVIWSATNQFGTVLENVVIDPKKQVAVILMMHGILRTPGRLIHFLKWQILFLGRWPAIQKTSSFWRLMHLAFCLQLPD